VLDSVLVERAVVLIGVRNSGTLRQLQTVQAGLDHMRHWALAQGVAEQLIAVLSDTDGSPVRSADIFDAINMFVMRPTLEQLIVYFCGHGMYKDRSEFWLLSGAPTNPNEAVNVAGSAVLAERLGVPHVVLISDACRSAPGGIQAGDVSGSLIFPNEPPRGGPAAIDQFYACRLGDSSFEIADATALSGAYRALYTEVLTKALGGYYPNLLERVTEPDGSFDLVRPRPLRENLEQLVTARIAEFNGTLLINQSPDARLTSGPEAWLSRLKPIKGRPTRRHVEEFEYRLPSPVLPTPAVRAARDAAKRLADPVAPTSRAVVVRGDTIAELVLPAPPGEDRPFSTALVALERSGCAVIPVVRGLFAVLTVEDGQLVDVLYQPSDDIPLPSEGLEVRNQLAAASRYGVAVLDLPTVGTRTRWWDPSLALYKAYALHDLGRRDQIEPSMLPDDRELFDVAMLRGGGGPSTPRTPLLSRGWPLLHAFHVEADTTLPRRQSFWTLFGHSAFDRLRAVINQEGG
jgi:hypothetical protein